ncbi:Hsp20/alpha crystallin family protein [Mangrovibacillus cuniculi]|uniref:Spore gernimation protein GerT n=1 Tax=Mangrovibacillus cuniculi TaxID=2593652 RepID=A0A7S8HFL6_9BACI|nr:Hsp20/alpha crystallin family protein [Mangrovibacillus cuniculi]QPC46565.1 spore gernimation protein GerT [Mangrovibacillus cuniculi]
MFPWKSLFPFQQKEIGGLLKPFNPNDVEQYIQSMMGKAMQGNFGQSDSSSGVKASDGHHDNIEVFETHEHVFVKVKKSEEDMKDLRVFHTSNQAILSSKEREEEQTIITLPSLVHRKGCIAKYRDGLLVLTFTKQDDMQFSEVDIRE